MFIYACLSIYLLCEYKALVDKCMRVLLLEIPTVIQAYLYYYELVFILMIKHRQSISTFILEDSKEVLIKSVFFFNFKGAYVRIYPQQLLLVILPKVAEKMCI